ncbi:MAG: hypothetical protein ACFFCW_06395 [Candidatus Hodarchaeota archaeon]
MVKYSGDTKEDERLWHTYLYWARKEARFPESDVPPKKKANVDNPDNRIDEKHAAALRIILFSCLALEYRLRRVHKALNISCKDSESETLWPFFKKFWKRLRETRKQEGVDFCTPPPEWADVEPDLKFLIRLRDKIVHAHYRETLQFIFTTQDPIARARELYRAVIHAIRLINQGTGYDPRDPKELEEHFSSLMVY